MLITSISGIRGTIGGKIGENLTPPDIVGFISAYGILLQKNNINANTISVVIGRDGRASGGMILEMVIQTLLSMGIDVINLDYATTPTVAMEVMRNNADGGIIVTASHNPKEYNGLKMLNNTGEFLSDESGKEILTIKQQGNFNYAKIDVLGKNTKSYNHTRDHINDICNLELVNIDAIRNAKIKVSVDAINSVGGLAVPILLQKLGVEMIGLYCEVNGDFQHKPEPLEENLGELKALVHKTESHLGIAVDPDVDRLVLIDEQGQMFGEEYTIVSVADYVLSKTPGSTVSNLSSSKALADVTTKYGQQYHTSAVGEKNVVEKMKEVNAVIGGEGSGGVIYPTLHYGRDALVGIALFLSYIAEQNIKVSELRNNYPCYFMSKQKIELSSRKDISRILDILEQESVTEKTSRIDGLKIDFDDSWLHVRSSNTEPIMRIITEAKTQKDADNLAQNYISKIKGII